MNMHNKKFLLILILPLLGACVDPSQEHPPSFGFHPGMIGAPR